MNDAVVAPLVEGFKAAIRLAADLVVAVVMAVVSVSSEFIDRAGTAAAGQKPKN